MGVWSRFAAVSRLTLFDRRGAGLSDRSSPSEPLSLPALALDIEACGPKHSEEMAQADLEAMGPPDMTERMTGNFDLFVAHELRQIGGYTPDIETLKGLSTKLVGAAGEKSGEQAACRAAHALAEHVGIAVSLLPGAHGGCGSDPQNFADALDKLFQSG